MGETGRDLFTELLAGSILAAVFVWAWMSVLGLMEHMDPGTQIVLSMLQYVFFGAGGFAASYLVSVRTRRFEARTGLAIGLGAWVISVTLFMPLSEAVTAATVILTLFSFLIGGHFGVEFSKRR